jgi:hypothetical protein
MKIFIIVVIVLLTLLLLSQLYFAMATNNTATQPYQVIRSEKAFEIRHYPAAMLAKVSSTSKSYRDLGYTGFNKLAKYIFGGNSENIQIGMTSPVHMEMGDSVSTMAFVMPSTFDRDNLPKPNSAEITIETTEPEYVAVIQFGGYASAESIEKQQKLLEKALKDKGLTWQGNFHYLGYNPPYQLFGRRNEVIVALEAGTY